MITSAFSQDDLEHAPADVEAATRRPAHWFMSDEPELYAWMAAARCRDLGPLLFFPSDGVGVEDAQVICRGCCVREACLEYALDHDIANGVWGGVSERGRRRLQRQRMLARHGAHPDE